VPIAKTALTISRLIVIPLSYLRRLDSLKYTSIAALVSMAYLVVLVVYHFIQGDTMEDRGPIRVGHWAGPVPTLSSLPVIVFAFTCHQNVSLASFGGLYMSLTLILDVLHSQ
jgi:amino acid permease